MRELTGPLYPSNNEYAIDIVGIFKFNYGYLGMTQPLDWTYLQSFTAVAEQGSLSAAARALGGSQPTMSRHISALETELGLQLFDRTSAGLVLTPTGTDLLQHARQMAEAASHLSLAATGRVQAIAGTVRVTASESMGVNVLPPILTALRRAEPEIAVELVASDQTDNLLLREADIAVRMYRPTQADVITRKVGTVEIGMFATQDYLERCGYPTTPEELGQHDLIGYDRSDQIILGFRGLGLNVGRDFFSFRCDNQEVTWRMVKAGYGIGFSRLDVGLAEPGVVRLFEHITMPQLPIWLTAHSELKTSARVRRVYDFLAAELMAAASTPLAV